jgi:hypothetical protein
MNAHKKGVQTKEGWKKPAGDFVKINVDANFSEEMGTGATGVVIRDHTGGVILWCKDIYHILVMHRWRRLIRCLTGFDLPNRWDATEL